MQENSYKQYTANFNASDIPSLYADWDWLINPKYLDKPWVMSQFGDLFFEGPDGGVFFLDTLEGTITPFAKDQASAEERLTDEATLARYLSSDAVVVLRNRGLLLKEDELYIYVPHPIVTGAVVLDSVQAMSMKVVVSLGAQLLRQVRPV